MQHELTYSRQIHNKLIQSVYWYTNSRRHKVDRQIVDRYTIDSSTVDGLTIDKHWIYKNGPIHCKLKSYT